MHFGIAKNEVFSFLSVETELCFFKKCFSICFSYVSTYDLPCKSFWSISKSHFLGKKQTRKKKKKEGQLLELIIWTL